MQALGLANLGYGGELGYISIQELIDAGVELDVYWTPKTIGAIKGNPEGADNKSTEATKHYSELILDALVVNDEVKGTK